MASYFRQSRNCELSLLEYLQTCFTNDWSDITLVKSFKQVFSSTVNLPIVCIRLADISSQRREIGSVNLEDKYLVIIDIFARSDAQRLDLADYIKEKLKNGWTHYDFSHASGDNTTLDKSANGRDFVTEFISNTKVEFGDDVEDKEKYRQTISIRVRKSS